MLTITAAAGIALAVLLRHFRQAKPRPVDRAAAAAVTTFTIHTKETSQSQG
jgi:hypothetical protein